MLTILLTVHSFKLIFVCIINKPRNLISKRAKFLCPETWRVQLVKLHLQLCIKLEVVQPFYPLKGVRGFLQLIGYPVLYKSHSTFLDEENKKAGR